MTELFRDIGDGLPKKFRVIPEVPQADITRKAEQPTNDPGFMAVIDVKGLISSLRGLLGLCSANRTTSTLTSKNFFIALKRYAVLVFKPVRSLLYPSLWGFPQISILAVVPFSCLSVGLRSIFNVIFPPFFKNLVPVAKVVGFTMLRGGHSCNDAQGN